MSEFFTSGSEQPPDVPCVLACSGCSRAGELADRTARHLNRAGTAKMSCLAGVGGRVKSILNTVQAAPSILMIDGCPLECGARTLRSAGIASFRHLKLHEQGVKKHSSEVCEPAVVRLAKAAEDLIQTDSPAADSRNYCQNELREACEVR